MSTDDPIAGPMPAALPLRRVAARPLTNSRLTLAVLLSVFAINFMDRQILALLVEPIKTDMGLSDTQIGLLYGFAFAVLFATAGIPIARAADRGNRARIVNWALVVFSLMTAACGLATSYWQLLAARVGVAIGEGGTNPPSHSIISDLYPIERRSTAMAIFALGPHVGLLLGFLVGGWIAQLWGWRAAFLVAGLIGLLFAAVSFACLREPAARQVDGVDAVEPPPAVAVLQTLMRHASLRHVFAGAALFSIAVYAVVGWLPSFLIRGHGLSTGVVGTVLALVIGLLGGAGTMFGGWVADRLGARDPGWRLGAVAIALVVMAPFWTIVFLTSDTTILLALLAIAGALLGFYLGPTFAMVQSLVDPSMRATAAACLLFVFNIVGLGLGPLAVGVLSDALQPDFGPKSLGIALLLVPPFCVWAAYHYYAAARTIGSDLARADADGRGSCCNEG